MVLPLYFFAHETEIASIKKVAVIHAVIIMTIITRGASIMPDFTNGYGYENGPVANTRLIIVLEPRIQGIGFDSFFYVVGTSSS